VLIPQILLEFVVLDFGLGPAALTTDLEQVVASAVVRCTVQEVKHEMQNDEVGVVTGDEFGLIQDTLDLGVDIDQQIVIFGHLVVTVVLLTLGPAAEVVATNCEDDVDDPLARELGVLLGVGEVLLHLGVVGRLR